MSALSGPVLLASAVMSAPAAWMVFQGTMTLTEGLERTLIVILICWAAISLVEAFVFPSARPRPPEEESPGALTAGSADTAD